MSDGRERRVDIGTKVTIAILIFCVTSILGLFINAVWSRACIADDKSNINTAAISSIKMYIINQDKYNASISELLGKQDNRIRDLEKAK